MGKLVFPLINNAVILEPKRRHQVYDSRVLWKSLHGSFVIAPRPQYKFLSSKIMPQKAILNVVLT